MHGMRRCRKGNWCRTTGAAAGATRAQEKAARGGGSAGARPNPATLNPNPAGEAHPGVGRLHVLYVFWHA